MRLSTHPDHLWRSHLFPPHNPAPTLVHSGTSLPAAESTSLAQPKRRYVWEEKCREAYTISSVPTSLNPVPRPTWPRS
ncbi:Uncharacterized protein HZ326_23723 [Fusarium oxysporum f. sp. albedinis]|nr:Uncharacterized protein HZ326_23723 [Fusarium oxysporum f. sp. albedinis]